jgi:hypothetical protein
MDAEEQDSRFAGRSTSEHGRALLPALTAELAASHGRIVNTAIVDCGVKTNDEADRALAAFLQWFLVVPACQNGQNLVMLKGPVDRLWHAMLLHTRLYRRTCDRYLGYFLEHEPRDGLPAEQDIQQTVEILVMEYGGLLSPLLSAWSPTTLARLKATDVGGARWRTQRTLAQPQPRATTEEIPHGRP